MRRAGAVRVGIEVVGLVLVPIMLVGFRIGVSVSNHTLAVDATNGYLPPAEGLLHGVSPYPASTYPPLAAVLFVPFAILGHPETILTALAILSVPAILMALSVRDWRCYGAAFLWGPVLSAIQTVNLTLWLVLAGAIAWRWRNRVDVTATASGLAIATKVISLPLVVWLASTRRVRSAVAALVVAAAVTGGLLAGIQIGMGDAGLFAGKAAAVPTTTTSPSYGPVDLLGNIGAPRGLGIAVVLLLVAGLCVLSARYGSTGDDKRSFAAAALATVVVAPNVWLHSLTFLLLPLGVLRPRLGVLWFAPVALVLVGVGHPAPWETLLLWGVVAIVGIGALAGPGANPERVRSGSS